MPASTTMVYQQKTMFTRRRPYRRLTRVFKEVLVNQKTIAMWLITLMVFGSGLMNIASVVRPGIPERVKSLIEIFPLEFIHLSRSLVLLIGFTLLISALHIFNRKKRAYYLVLFISLISAVFHLFKGLNYLEAGWSISIALVLYLNRSRFTVKSGIPKISRSLARIGIGVFVAFCYGVAGFWFLEHRDFHIEFHITDAIRETILYLSWIGDSELIPYTHFAQWFLDSLYYITAAGVIYTIFSLFSPVYYQFKIHPRERIDTKKIIEKHGKSAMDFFKFWPDKSYFFSSSHESVVAYRVGHHFAIALADPVGPEHEVESTIRAFQKFCTDNGWHVAFHQTLPAFLKLYEKAGYKKLKIGDEAVVDLKEFNLAGHKRKELRHTINRIQNECIVYKRYDPPISDEVLYKLSEVSDEWLTIPGRRERQFTLGVFDIDYVRTTPVSVAERSDGSIMAFLNEIPSYYPKEGTIDLMRRRVDGPDGLMDFLMTSIILYFKEQGFDRFNMGMAPMSGFSEHEESTREERAIHYFFQNLNFLFSYSGLKHFKAKYASIWEPRYAIYRNVLELPQMVLALREISEIKRHN